MLCSYRLLALAQAVGSEGPSAIHPSPREGEGQRRRQAAQGEGVLLLPVLFEQRGGFGGTLGGPPVAALR